MGRNEVTRGLSRLLEDRLSRNTCVWAPEACIGPLGMCRPDYLAVFALGGRCAALGDIERAYVEVYEVKSCMADLNSGSGLNAVGDCNYIVAPYELMMEAARQAVDGEGPVPGPGWGWAYPAPSGCMDPDAFPPYEGQTEGWGLRFVEYTRWPSARPMPIFVYLWALLCSPRMRGAS